MSSILKALKKLENDKSICKTEQLRIDSKILQDDSSARLSRTTLFLIAVALFVCGGGATFIYMKQGSSDKIVSQTFSPRAELLNTAPPTPSLLKRDTAQKTTASTITQRKEPTVLDARMRLRDNNSLKKLQQTLPKNTTDRTPVQTAAPEPAPESKTIGTKSSVTRPVLTVNGIAFQDGGNDNLAVINGITVSSGAVIEGIRVEDIQKDRVHFSQGGEKFEIILNKSNR